MDTRERVEALLHDTPDGLDAQELAHRLDVHPNTVRWHLSALAHAGLTSTPLAPAGRVRPRIVYRLPVARVTDDEACASVLALLTDLGFRPEATDGRLTSGPSGPSSPAASVCPA